MESYFRTRLLKVEGIAPLFNKASTVFIKDSKEHKLIKFYLAAGIAMGGDLEFNRFMTEMHDSIHADSDAIFDELKNNLSALKKTDPFLYQMSLNLAFQLQFDNEKKVELFGDALQTSFQMDRSGKINPISTSITNALILMKESGITYDQAKDVIKRGQILNSNSKQASEEYRIRIKTYYPEYQ